MASKYDELKQAISDYGEAAMENLVRCKGIGQAIVAGFPEWLGCPAERVTTVPPGGQFDPRRDYAEAAFSYHNQPVIRLEPIIFGICVAVQNVEDSGALWLRTAIRLEVTGDTFDIFVANQPAVHVSLDYDNEKLAPVFEAIHKELMQVFKTQLAEFNDSRYERGIGFFVAPEEATDK
ncbi:MAG: hypothetical protein MRY72_05340 [Aquisalinus sp.]|nr:hypothetical protein [Aquisalinus sp.]